MNLNIPITVVLSVIFVSCNQSPLLFSSINQSSLDKFPHNNLKNRVFSFDVAENKYPYLKERKRIGDDGYNNIEWNKFKSMCSLPQGDQLWYYEISCTKDYYPECGYCIIRDNRIIAIFRVAKKILAEQVVKMLSANAPNPAFNSDPASGVFQALSWSCLPVSVHRPAIGWAG